MAIHPTAIVDRHAELDSSVQVGPYAIIDAHVRIAENAKVLHHAYVTGWTEIGHFSCKMVVNPQDRRIPAAPSSP